jgi:hypothetical protein
MVDTPVVDLGDIMKQEESKSKKQSGPKAAKQQPSANRQVINQ